jgi:arabinofuranan 3-O-arabinosyltransferase
MRLATTGWAHAGARAGEDPNTIEATDRAETVPMPTPAPLAPWGDIRAERRLLVISLGVLIGYLASLALMAVDRTWIVDTAGRPIPTDFIAIWSAGRLALSGAALSAYDGALQHAAEAAAIGRDFAGRYGWPYPPIFLFVASTLARLPYAWAFALFVSVCGALHGLSIAAITRRLGGAIAAFAAPWALACVMVGQNGFLTAAIIGAALLTLDKRPALSGVLLGILTYKPHFGLLFPLALMVSGRWRVFAWATVSALCLAGLSSTVFGVDTFMAFLHGLPRTTRTLVTDGGVGWNKLQSVYGLARSLGAPNAPSWAAQGAMSIACGGAVAVLWRGRAPIELKAAALAVAAVMVTPYVFAYDLPVLSVAAAFLYRHRGFDRMEYAALTCAALSIALLPFVAISTGLFAGLAIALIVGRRVIAASAGKPSVDAVPPRAALG